MGVRVRVASDLVSVINEERTDLLGMDALGFGIAEVFGIEVKGAFHAVTVAYFGQTNVSANTVIVTECDGLGFSFRVTQKTITHSHLFLS
jgi:hypothetical protein